MRSDKKGFILIIVLVFSVIALVASTALFMAISSTYKVAGVGEEQDVKGYYAVHAGARYAYVILQNLAKYNAGRNLTVGQTLVVDVDEDHEPTLFKQLNLKSPHTLKIKITRTGDADDNYAVETSYS